MVRGSIVASILQDAEAAAHSIADAARTECAAILDAARLEAESVIASARAFAAREAQVILRSRKTAARLEARLMRLAKKRAVLDEVYSAAAERLAAAGQDGGIQQGEIFDLNLTARARVEAVRESTERRVHDILFGEGNVNGARFVE